MYILGINAYHGDVSAALLKDGVLVAAVEEERFRLNFRSATEPLEDPLRLRGIRKDIARLKTILRERELESAR